ncbi:hypothetical protein PPL_06651 [Heterostelium album PN500]|uniref:Uncharacterized protein n=1 Tax=Heterostelium pallidum (strain ATCC 26659 / Pp 5 / PN500) TaxID=670386 RepID=D3BFB8_HETP5|nr:hypothetical protein PPL_06651 [Heterostelium album PN500]EFA79832.1 hypothetical protein PPL_06651 [Heterostelium album PN500]|eukprot:XP_020431953.1 hypothetical protein PPL_06651 [Heterostelium album PN500]
MCSRCTTIHNNKHPDHVNQYDHIDDIRQSLNTLYLSILDFVNSDNNIKDNSSGNNVNDISIKDDRNINNNNNDMPVESKINFTINSIWESLRSSTSVYDSLTTAENEIKQYFEQIHTFLINEEHRLKKPIINQKDAIIDQIDNNINHLKHLINMININNNIEHACGNGNDNDVDNTDTPVKIPDITDLYSTTTIMNSIAFIIYNIQFRPATSSLSTHTPASYELSIKRPDFEQLKLTLEQSIQLERIESSTSTTENENITQYIFSTHHKNGATLINLQNNSIEQFEIDYSFHRTSIVSVGEDIYTFGGYDNQTKWMKFSMKSKSVALIGEMEGIDGGFSISACYDGRDHIYLLNARKKNINRFNIYTMKFERYRTLPEDYSIQRSSMIFQGSLYSYDLNKMLQINLVNKEMTHHLLDIIAHSACNDNKGNFYISYHPKRQGQNHGVQRFVKYNIESKEMIDLNAIPARYNLMYHRESPTSSFIYSITGIEHGNFKYSIERNQYEPFFQHDKFKRNFCPSTPISIKNDDYDDDDDDVD